MQTVQCGCRPPFLQGGGERDLPAQITAATRCAMSRAGLSDPSVLSGEAAPLQPLLVQELLTSAAKSPSRAGSAPSAVRQPQLATVSSQLPPSQATQPEVAAGWSRTPPLGTAATPRPHQQAALGKSWTAQLQWLPGAPPASGVQPLRPRRRGLRRPQAAPARVRGALRFACGPLPQGGEGWLRRPAAQVRQE